VEFLAACKNCVDIWKVILFCSEISFLFFFCLSNVFYILVILLMTLFLQSFKVNVSELFFFIVFFLPVLYTLLDNAKGISSVKMTWYTYLRFLL